MLHISPPTGKHHVTSDPTNTDSIAKPASTDLRVIDLPPEEPSIRLLIPHQQNDAGVIEKL
jgi:hypothetical protein